MDIHRYHTKIKGINLFNWKKKAIFFPRKQNQKAWALNKWDVQWKKGLTTAAKLYRTYAFSNTENLCFHWKLRQNTRGKMSSSFTSLFPH